MDRKNVVLLALIFVAFIAIESYAQTVNRDQLIQITEKLDQYKAKQISTAASAFSLYYYYTGMEEAEMRFAGEEYGQVGILVDRTIGDASMIQSDMVNNVNNYENVRLNVRGRFAELKENHRNAQKIFEDTTDRVRNLRSIFQRPVLVSPEVANVLIMSSYQTDAALSFSNQVTGFERRITSDEIRNGDLPAVISSYNNTGSIQISFNNSGRYSGEDAPTSECNLRLKYAENAVTGTNLLRSSDLVALGGSFATNLISCNFKINGVYYYDIESPRKLDDKTVYCTLPPAVVFEGRAEVWITGTGCRESDHIEFIMVK